MQEKFNHSTTLRPEGDRVLDAESVEVNLLSAIQQLRSEASWTQNDRNSITLFKSEGTSILLIALHQGATMRKHSAEGLISLQVLEGKMLLNTNNRSIALTQGEMIVLHKGIPHSIEAIDETIFLLTIAFSPMQE